MAPSVKCETIDQRLIRDNFGTIRFDWQFVPLDYETPDAAKLLPTPVPPYFDFQTPKPE
jgi:hypothetical protein